MKNINDQDFNIKESDYIFNYQKELTVNLDNYRGQFNRNIINEIVLWKVNRYAHIKHEILDLINSIDSNSLEIDLVKTQSVLKGLLDTKGIKLPMASTILMFRNRNIYQIIDQRVFRLIYPDKRLRLSGYVNEANQIAQIELYLQYLIDLRQICDKLKIPFSSADRILYRIDKRINSEHKLDNY